MPRKLERIDAKDLIGNPRCRLPAWLRYQHIVEEAYRRHPRPYIYRPPNMSALTVTSQLRDAIRGAIAFGHPSSIPVPDLIAWYSQIIIKHLDGEVYIGTPEERAVVPLLPTVAAPTVSDPYSFDTLSLEELIAFTILLSTNRVRGPVTVHQPPSFDMLPPRPNVEVITKPDGSLVLL